MFKKPLWQNSVEPDQAAPIGAVCFGSTLFASILNSSVMLGKYLQQTTFSDAFCLTFRALALKLEQWANQNKKIKHLKLSHAFCYFMMIGLT